MIRTGARRSLVTAMLVAGPVLGPPIAAQGAIDTVVRVLGAPAHRSVGRLEEEVTIGVADGPDEYLIGDIGDLTVLRDGSVVIWDQKARQVRLYDGRGRFVRNIGRHGGGPGEYRNVSGVAPLKDGRIIVWDTGNWRINVYSGAGEFETQWTTASGAAGAANATFARGLRVDTAGFIYLRRTLFGRPLGEDRPVWIRLHPDGRVADTLRAPELPSVPQLVARNGGATARTDLPFAPRAFATFSPHGYFVTGFADRLSVELHQPGGAIISLRGQSTVRRVDPAARDSARRRVEELLRRTQPGWNWNGPAIPTTRPAYAALRVGNDGKLWLAIDEERLRPGQAGGPMGVGLGAGDGVGGGPPRRLAEEASNEGGRPALYDVIQPGGVYLGRVQVPAGVMTFVMDGDTVWGVAYDADDVPRVKRYRIRWDGAR